MKKTTIYIDTPTNKMLIFVLFILNIYQSSAVFPPLDSAALNAAVGGCLGETPDGSCPTFAASNDATGNPYGVMGDWDVSKVTSLFASMSTPPSLVSVVAFFT